MSEVRDPAEIFRERVKEVRVLRGLNQSELAGKAGLPTTSIAHFEGGGRKPSFDNLRRLANALGVTADYLLGRTNTPEVAQADDPLFREVSLFNEADRELARRFIQMLAEKNQNGEIKK